MRILIAPDKFKGTLPAMEAARAMARGARLAISDATLTIIPVADGGHGTLDALREAAGTRPEPGLPEGAETNASAILSDGTGVVESAASTDAPSDPLGASTFETGAAVAVCLQRGASSLTVGVGGTISTDGGTGAARALGWRFLDGKGDELPPGGGPLLRLREIVPPTDPIYVPVIGACDVDVPLTGPFGCARVFAPQKGAGPRDVEVLDEAMHSLQARIADDLGIDVGGLPFAGAGGGLGAGLHAFFGARLAAGAGYVLDKVGFYPALGAADLVLTGEGSLDAQSLVGKAPGEVARAAAARGIPCLAIAGRVELDEEERLRAGFTRAVGLAESDGSDPAASVERATMELLQGWVTR